MYETIDQILSVVAVAITLLCCTRWVRRGSSRGLVEVADRARTLREDSVIAAVLAYLLGAMVLTGVAQAFFSDPDDIRSRLIVGNGAQIIGFIACLAIASKRFTGGAKHFVFARPGGTCKLTVFAFVGLMIVAVGLCPLVRDATVIAVRYVAEGYEFSSHPTIVALGGDGVGFSAVVALWLGAIVIAPLAEEAFFRGILQTFALNIFQSRRTAILLASLAFGLVHFQQPQAIPALVALGVVLGYSYERSGSLLVPVVIHAIFNLKTLIWYAATGSPQ